jgi:hypothetical protein
LIHASPVSGHPFGAWCPKIGAPRNRRAAPSAGSCRARTDRAQRRRDELERALHLGAVRRAAEELRARDDRAHGLADVAVGPTERRRGALDERGRRIVAHESDRQLARDEPRRRGMPRHDVQHLLAVLDAAPAASR